MSTFLIQSVTFHSSCYLVVLSRLCASRSRPNPHLKLQKFPEPNPQLHSRNNSNKYAQIFSDSAEHVETRRVSNSMLIRVCMTTICINHTYLTVELRSMKLLIQLPQLNVIIEVEDLILNYPY